MTRDISPWMTTLLKKLTDQFGQRIVFVGLQGSYARGEATEQSDIDVVFILNELTVDDLSTYKTIIQTMPSAEKACGFICGRSELLAWPKSDLLQLVYDTISYYGELHRFVSPFDRCDWIDAVKLGAGNLYHEICHRYVFGGDLSEQIEELKPAYKAVFFILRQCVYLETGLYISKRDALEEYLSDTDKQMLRIYEHWPTMKNERQSRATEYFAQLMNWSRSKLVQYE